ncbi:NADP-dependent aldehyde dehydrogenase [Novosphingobium sp. SG751A]|uniref:aldehyde dehydrogenase (NADP(+)) n=1 Tax=Novosphingobium sp. SG751A TaxID=2587000 RepID=UPI001551DA37|nr:aldehyde dehydrogenase (NADP(+)) [Novosphingobium sp. SG751A]NOW44827.1 NADP-dependent aldehyde dehydrogenase [Novosphingobium sp. SG751A]
MIDGSLLIAGKPLQTETRFSAIDAASGKAFGPDFSVATPEHVDAACAAAQEAAPAFARDAAARADLLEAIGAQILSLGDGLIETAMRETGLPRARLEGERMRTVNQLRLFAAELRGFDWQDEVFEPADLARVPPRPSLRRINRAVGPVAVFGASNFPLAFSVAGGDTASALAAGCPVVVKGHSAHPGTGEYVARAVTRAVAESGFPAGVFSFLPGNNRALGAALVGHPAIKAVGFTGSRAGGLALIAQAQARPEPIPVYAEMSSINPVLLLPAAMAARGGALARAYAASLSMGAGQFCTNPGLLLAVEGPELDAFLSAAAAALDAAAPQVMLSPGICRAYHHGVAALDGHAGVTTILRQNAPEDRCGAAIFAVDAARFIADPALREEVFGVSGLVVRCASPDDFAAVLASLEGQLTASFHGDEADWPLAQALLPIMADKAGRVIANEWPTGVEVSRAMVHGGPFPATSDTRTTSVGTLAMARFLRPVCFQNMPFAID